VSKFSLVIGGPFYRAMVRMRLVECPGPNIRGRLMVFFALTWIPMLTLSLAEGMAFGSKVKIPFLYDFWIYARIFASLPLFLLAEIVVDPWIRRVISTFDSSGIVRESDLAAYRAALQKIEGWRDSSAVEFALAILAFFPYFIFLDHEWVSSTSSNWHGSMSASLTGAGWWFVFVTSPALRFLLIRWLWRYVLWSLLLRSIARLNLNLTPAHPDLLGGLGFLLQAQQHFGILCTAVGSIIAGQYANSITFFGAPIAGTQAPIAVFVVLSILFVLGPLTVFSPRLVETRRSGVARYSQAGRRLTAAFDAKWASGTDSARQSMLGSADPSSLIDFVSSYFVIRDMKLIPINKRVAINIALQAAAPFAVLWFFATPLDRIVKTLLQMVM